MQSENGHKVGGHVVEDQKQIWISSWWINHLGSVQTKFYSGNWLIQSIILFVNNNKGIEWRRLKIEGGGLINFLPGLKGGELIREGWLILEGGWLYRGLMVYEQGGFLL